MAIPTTTEYPMPRPESFPANKTNWQPEPDRAVLLILDMQQYFLQFYAAESALVVRLIENLDQLRDWARKRGVPIVYTVEPDTHSQEERGLFNDLWGRGLAAAGPAQSHVVDRLRPDSEATVLTKWRYSAFQRSELHERMIGWRRDQLVIGGIFASTGCLLTAAEAFMRDIQPFVVGDAVADITEAEHRLALEYVATRCGCIIECAHLTGQGHHDLKVIQQWLLKRLSQLLKEETELDPTENLIFYGLDSLQVMKLAAELKQRGITVGFDELARSPTVNGWLSLIERKHAAL